MLQAERFAHYRYGLLDPRIEPAVPAGARAAAEHHNAPLLGPRTLGIEVTVPALAARCGLGNVDPQHDGSADRRAAIDVCLELDPPARDSVLLTVRPDPDAFGSMALLALRARQRVLPETVARRVTALSLSDRFARGPWPGPRPFPQAVEELDESPIVGALKILSEDRRLLPAERVAGLGLYLLRGEIAAEYRSRIAHRQAETLRRLTAGEDRIEPSIEGRIAVLRGGSDGALALAYRLAPVVIAESLAFGSPPHRKLTVAQYDASHVDLRAAGAALARREPGWGGSATIIGSPQGRPCVLSLEIVQAVVRACLLT